MTIHKHDIQEFSFAFSLVILAVWAILQHDANLLATVVFLPNLLLFVPQFMRTFVHKDTDGLSFGSMATLGSASIFFALGGLLVPEIKMLVVNAVSLALCMAICWTLNKKTGLLYIAFVTITTLAAYFIALQFELTANPYLFIGGWLANVGLIQQCWSIHKTGHTHGISFKTFLMIMFVGGVWLAWAIEINLWGTILSNSIGLLCSGYICTRKLMNWRKDHA